MKEKIGAKSLLKQLVSGVLLQNSSNTLSENEANHIVLMVLNHYLGLSRNDIVLNQPIQMDTQANLQIREALQKIARDEPVQYVLGEADFYGRKFKVNPAVLIPRRETEELVYLIIKENKHKKPHILDIGTGSGCIAITLKKEIPEAEVHGWDISTDALSVTRQNADNLQVEIFSRQVDITNNAINAGHQKFDIIASNPPYVRESERAEMQANVLFEPALALFVPDEQPLLFYASIAQQCIHLKLMNPGGMLYFEVNEYFANETAGLMTDMGLEEVVIVQDMQKKDRFVKGMLSS